MEVHDENRGRRRRYVFSPVLSPVAQIGNLLYRRFFICGAFAIGERIFPLVSLSWLALLAALPVQKLAAQQPAPPGAVVLVTVRGGVEVMRAGATRWDAADTNQVHKELSVG